jgi:hypothetical protein
MALYFASQGAGRMTWPVIAGAVRLALAALGGWAAVQGFGSLGALFTALALALVAFGAINAAAVARGAWRR